MSSIEKEARKPSSDPIQEHLRQHKATWNKDVSAFIAALISLKQALNGYPVPKIGLPKGNIKEPLSPMISQLLNQLADHYSALTQDGKGIVEEQTHYSENRRKPQPHLPPQSVPSEQAPTVAETDINLIKEASNPLTRLWTYIKTPFQFSDKDRWVRKEMLQSAAQIEKMLIEIGNLVLSRQDDAIPNAVFLAKDLSNLFVSGISEPLNNLNKAKAIENALKPKEEKSEEVISITTPATELSTEVKRPKEIQTIHLNRATFEKYLKPLYNVHFDSFRAKFPEVIGINIGTFEDGSEKVIGLQTKDGPVANQEEKVYTAPSIDQETIDLDTDGNPDLFEAIARMESELPIITRNLVHIAAGLSEAGVPEKHQQDILSIIADLDGMIPRLRRDIHNHSDFQDLRAMYNDINEKYNLVLATVNKYSEFKGAAIDDDIKKFAQNRTSRWFRRQWSNLIKGRDFRMRQEADRFISKADRHLATIMNMLQEKNAPLDTLTQEVVGFALAYGEFIKYLLLLADNFNNQAQLIRFNGPGKRIIPSVPVRDMTYLKNRSEQFEQMKRFIRKDDKK